MLGKVTLASKTFATFMTLVFLTKSVNFYVSHEVRSPLKLHATPNTLKFPHIRMHPRVLHQALLVRKSFPTLVTLEPLPWNDGARGHLALGVLDDLLGSNGVGLFWCIVGNFL